MSFSRLLLAAANSKKFIRGRGEDKVIISPKISEPHRDPYEGEVILCFQLDDRSTEQGRQIPRSLGMPENSQRCDGLVFYSQDEDMNRLICLVEMKSTNVTDTENQIISTKDYINSLLREECEILAEEYRAGCLKQLAHIIWKACLYHHGASPTETREILMRLKKSGFTDVAILDHANNDLRPYLIGSARGAKEMAKKVRRSKRR